MRNIARPGSRGVTVKGLLLLLAVTLSLACATLTPDEKIARGLVVLNDFQDTAAHVYDEAKVQEAAGGKACREAAAIKSVALPAVSPATIVELRAACDTLGTPIPYDPYKLQALAVKAGKAGDTPGALKQAATAVRSLLAGAREVGVKFPPAVISALEALGL